MKVKQLKHIYAIDLLQATNHFQHFGCSQSKLCGFPTGFFPAAGALRVELDAHSKNRSAAAIVALSNIQHMIEFVEFFDHNDYSLAATRAGKCEFDELFVLETIKNQQALRRLFQRERGIEFRFGTGL